MMRSMFTGVTGLRVHQSRMDVIAHNIANVNTTGFKASFMTFSEAFSQTIAGASAPQPAVGRGGTNPQQIGLGANVSAIQRIMSPGAAQRTDDPLHLMINGDGFFVVGDNTGLFFTRAGEFVRDAHSNVVLPGSGLQLQGWPASTVGGVLGDITVGPVQPVRITPEMETTPPQATSQLMVSGNLQQGVETWPSSINVRDSQGNSWSIPLEFRQVSNPAYPATAGAPQFLPNQWDLYIENPDGASTMTRSPDNAVFPTTGSLQALFPGFPARISFNDSGNLVAIDDAAAGLGFNASTGVLTIELPDDLNGTAAAPADSLYNVTGAIFGRGDTIPPNAWTIDFSGLTQAAAPSSIRTADQDGLAPGVLTGLSVGQDGIIEGLYSNGTRRQLWQIPIAVFSNPAGLESLGGNVFAMTGNSGDFDGIGSLPGAVGSTFMPGTLEMSNVELASEFTSMITTQRGFQSNSRIITVSDEMLQELANLRR